MSPSSQNPYAGSPNLSTRSYDSSPVSSVTSPNSSSQLLTGAASLSSTPQPPGLSSLPLMNQSFRSYTSAPQESLPSTESVSGTPGPSHPHPSGQGQKRAYRQRRKDPSCDACRERKVKCDATETTSCSECSSRNVKCQFTKETNRRMSSIKQVQDLEKQMERVKRENSGLKRMLQDKDMSMDLDAEGPMEDAIQLPSVGTDPKRRSRPTTMPELSKARLNVLNYSKGAWKPPAPYRNPAFVIFDPPRPELPRPDLADQLIRCYKTFSHSMFPILHFPTFRAMVDDIYETDSGSQLPPCRLALFFSVLAAGSLFSPTQPGSFYQPAEFLDIANKLIDPWNNDVALDDVRTFILISLCLNELNLKSASWSWLGRAVRAGQDLGLNIEAGPWPVIEGEMRRRTWWMIYIWDRTLATELGRPFLIRDDDCDVSLPAGVDDQYIHEGGMLVPNGVEPLTHSLLAVIYVVRCYTALIEALSPSANASVQVTLLDNHFKKCLGKFPPACDPSSTAALPPLFLAPLAYLFHARLLLHRHHLDPKYPIGARLASVESCTHVALEFASLLNRSNPSLLADGATALLIMLVFRCTLFLLLTGYVDQSLTCIRALESMSSRRDIAIPCGRFLSFFVSELATKRTECADYLSRNTPPPSYGTPRPVVDNNAILHMLSRDEELLVYASADLQASPNASWLWTGLEREMTLPQLSGFYQATSRGGSNLIRPEARTGLTQTEVREWSGWGGLDAAVRSLNSSTDPTPAPANTAWLLPPPIKSETPALTMEIPTRPSGLSQSGYEISRTKEQGNSASPVAGGATNRSGSGSSGPGSSGRDRLSIANII